jgi:uncharacterized FAD-dependent dehydrogenase
MTTLTNYDIGIIGAGPAGIFAAYELIKLNPKLKIVMIEQGKNIYNRVCPIAEDKVESCIHCNPCSIMRGFGGAGAFSDGKYNLTTNYGGWLNEYLSDREVMDLIYYVDNINNDVFWKASPGSKHLSDRHYTSSGYDIEKQGLAHDLHLLEGGVRHLGTENNLVILKALYNDLKDKITIEFESEVLSFAKGGNEFIVKVKRAPRINHIDTIVCDYLIAAPGRAGAEWFATQCKLMDLNMINNQVDVGVRVELPAEIWSHITSKIYEAKFMYRTRQYGDIVRTFCMNPYGKVVMENTDGIMTVNGHSYSDISLGSHNTNFALLVSNKFTEPFNEPHQYGKRIASFSNMLGGGVIIQRFGDLINGRRTNEHRLAQSFVKPTLKATPGDLSLVLPKRHLDNIIEMIYALDAVAPGTSNDDTLLYGVEVKFYSSRLELSKELETKVPNMFAVGDGAGITRGLSQASASGVHVARIISERIGK